MGVPGDRPTTPTARHHADVAVEVRLTDAPLTIRRPDVIVCRADAIHARPIRAQHLVTIDLTRL
jgi:hypothetical protein